MPLHTPLPYAHAPWLPQSTPTPSASLVPQVPANPKKGEPRKQVVLLFERNAAADGSVAAGEHYDAASRRWSPLAADGARGGCAAVVVGQTLFLFGGSVTDIRSYTPGAGWAAAGKRVPEDDDSDEFDGGWFWIGWFWDGAIGI